MGMYKAKPRLVDLYTEDSTIFANLTIPEGLESATAKAVIMQECGELQTVFEDAADLKAYLAPWSAAHALPWTRMLAALSAEYNPIHNYDRTDTETITDTETGTSETSGTETTTDSETRAITQTGSESENGSESGSGSATTEVGKTDTSTIKKMGFNSNVFVDSDQTVVEATESGETTTTGSSTTSREMESEEITNGSVSKTGSKTLSGSEETSKDAERERTLTSQGNIGVTTAQQMITAEIDMRAAYNMYEIIMQTFKREICVAVW